MKHKTSLILTALISITALGAPASSAQSIGTRWNTPSRFTPAQASDLLYRQADGQSVSAADLFEAEKYLRSDGTTSLAGNVVRDALTKLLSKRVASFMVPVRVRSLPPVLQWLESTNYGTSVRLRGESVQVATLNADPNLAAVVLYHQTIFKDWKLCGSSPCFTIVTGAVRSQIGYQLSVPLLSTTPGEARTSELILATGLIGSVYMQTFPSNDSSSHVGIACDPIPSQTIFPPEPATSAPVMTFLHTANRTEGGRNNQALCGFFSLRTTTSSRFTYLNGNALSVAPATASRSAVKNNPLDFQLFQ